MRSQAEDEEQSWSAIAQLHRFNTEAVYAKAVRLCRSPTAHNRRIGVDVLAQLGLPEQTYHEPVMHVLLAMLETEDAPADPLLLPALQQIQAQWSGKHEWPYQLLEEAIAAM